MIDQKTPVSRGIIFDHRHHEFAAPDGEIGIDIAAIRRPLSVIVQVTRRCPLACAFCSESEQFPDPSFQDLESLAGKLAGVTRVYLSGGEPLMRRDIFEVIDFYRQRFSVVGLPTNCMYVTREVAGKLAGKVSYINAGLDGPRSINNEVRGGFDEIIQGLVNLRITGIEVSLSTVILRKTLPHLQYVVAIADALNVIKVKLVVPVPRGRAVNLSPADYASDVDIARKFKELSALKAEFGWKPRIKYALWDSSTEGYAILIYPNQEVFA